MDARQRRSKSSLTKFHERTSSLPPSACPEELRLCQQQCPTKRLNNQNLVKDFVVFCRMFSCSSLVKCIVFEKQKTGKLYTH